MFAEDLKTGRKYERMVANLYEQTGKEVVMAPQQWWPYDFTIDGVEVEVKADIASVKTKNLAIEVERVFDDGEQVDSGIITFAKDYPKGLWYHISGNKLWIIPALKLREYVNTCFDRRFADSDTIQDRHYRTRCCIVPIVVFEEEFTPIVDWQENLVVPIQTIR